MGFGESVRTCLRKYGDFSGRAARPEFWYFQLFVILSTFFTSTFDSLLFGYGFNDFGPIYILGYVALFLPTLSVSVRRLHDIDRTGIWIWVFWALALPTFLPEDYLGGFIIPLAAILLVLIVILLVFFLLPGTKGENRFEPNPYAKNSPPESTPESGIERMQ